MVLIGEGVAVWNKTSERVDACLVAAEYDAGGRQTSVTMTQLLLEPGARTVLPVQRGGIRLFLCDRGWRPLTAPLDG
jgi:hypothetical protein